MQLWTRNTNTYLPGRRTLYCTKWFHHEHNKTRKKCIALYWHLYTDAKGANEWIMLHFVAHQNFIKQSIILYEGTTETNNILKKSPAKEDQLHLKMETTAVLFQDFGPSQMLMIELSCLNLAPFFHSQAFGHLKNIKSSISQYAKS